jgi:hypothetical protein
MGSKEATEPKRLTIRELDEITDNFSAERLIGRGGYGTVYKVRLRISTTTFRIYLPLNWSRQGCSYDERGVAWHTHLSLIYCFGEL